MPFDPIDATGLAAGLFVLLSFYATHPPRQRRLALVSNVLFCVYGTALQLWPVVMLHGLLLPLNLLRLRQMRPSRAARGQPVPLQALGWFALPY